jgi:hypothetical protein
VRLAGLLALALGVRIVVAARVVVVPRDSVTLLGLARAARDGDLATLLAHHQHPLYPGLAGLVARLGPGIELAGTAVAVLAGALAVIPLVSIARRVVGDRAALVAGALLALAPYPARYAGVPLTDSLHLALALGGIAAGLRALEAGRAVPWALGSGLLLGAAYLTRPEGALAALVVLGALAIAGRGRARWLAPAVLLAGLLVTAGPYLAHLRAEREAFTPTGKWKAGGEAKASEFAEITGHERSTLPRAMLETARELSVTLHPLLAVLAVIGLAWRGRPSAAGVVTGVVALLVLTACARLHWMRGYLSHRHVLLPSVLLLPLAARGCLRIADRIRHPEALAVLVVAVGAVLAPKTFVAQGADKAHLVEMGRRVAAARLPDGPLALHGDPRVAHYAGRVALRLPGPIREVVREKGLPAALGPGLRAWLEERDARLYVFPGQMDGMPAGGLRVLADGAGVWP